MQQYDNKQKRKEMKAIKNPSNCDYLGGRLAEDEGSNINKRLERYAVAHQRALLMSDYIHDKASLQQLGGHELDKLGNEISHCGSWLTFRDYYTLSPDERYKLINADFCKKHLLCPLCAIRRGAKAMQGYLPKYEQILQKNPKLKGYLVTFTLANGESLEERFNHLRKSLSKQTQIRANYIKRGGKSNEFCKSDGGIYSIEVKRGKNSGLWHPHAHMIWLCEESPDQEQLRKEWKEYTGDSFVVDVTPFYGDPAESFSEVFKYALKFSELELEDNWEAYQFLKGKRLVNPFGCMIGVIIDEDLTDQIVEGDLPYIDLFYRYIPGVGYDLIKHEKGENLQESRDTLKALKNSIRCSDGEIYNYHLRRRRINTKPKLKKSIYARASSLVNTD